MNIWSALGFIGLGVAVAEFYNIRMWIRYKEGRREGREDSYVYSNKQH